MKLHEAIVEVLKTKVEQTATTKEISDQIAQRSLYQRKSDGDFPPTGQISARVNKYLHLFQKLPDGRVHLK